MKSEIQTEILIEASSEKIWSILTNFDKYPSWNPFIKNLEGTVKVGNKVAVTIEPPNSKKMSFKPKILVYDINKEIRWMGRFIFPGLFDGEHKFELIDNHNGTIIFRQSEKFTGIFVRYLNVENTKKGFESMNEKLKLLAEQK